MFRATKKMFMFYIFLSSLFFLTTAQTPKKSVLTSALRKRGCTILNHTQNTTHFSHSAHWYEMIHPLLNCYSNTETSLHLNMTGVEHVRSVSLSYWSLLHFDIDQFEFFLNLSRIEIKQSHLTTINPSKRNLVLSSVTFLSITESYILNIPNQALRSFPNLKQLVITSRGLAGLFEIDFAFNQQLEVLYIVGEDTLSFTDKWMSNLNLTSLKLQKIDGLTTIPSRLCSMPALKFVDLSFNRISSIKNGAFSNCSNLASLKLSNNSIQTIEYASFQGAGNLFQLDLSGNKLTVIPSGVFDSLRKYRLNINLYGNKLNSTALLKLKEKIMSSGLASNIFFSYEDQSHTYMSYKYNDAYSYIYHGRDYQFNDSSTTAPKLCPKSCKCFQNRFLNDIWMYRDRSFLDIYPSQFYDFHMGTSYSYDSTVTCWNSSFKVFPIDEISNNVQYISMSGNEFTILKLETFLKFDKTLQVLSLPGNKIERISSPREIELNKVHSLHLHHNEITSITVYTFMAFPNLVTIRLQHNKITTISPHIFLFNQKLRNIIMGPNPISSFQEDFYINSKIRHLFLANISLVSIPSSVQILSYALSIKLDDNYIKVIRNDSFRDCYSLRSLSLRNNRISSIEPKAFQFIRTTRRFELDLSFNNIRALSPDIFSHLHLQLSSILLVENHFVCDCNLKDLKIWSEKEEWHWDIKFFHFRCENPPRMKSKLFYKLTSDDLICLDNESDTSATDKHCSNSSIPTTILIIVLALLCCLVAALLLKKYFCKTESCRRNERSQRGYATQSILKDIELS